MLVYTATKRVFSDHVVANTIVDELLAALRERLGRGVAESEVRAYRHSLQYMHNILLDPEIPDEAGVAIEYQIPQTAKRVDFIISGIDAEQRESLIIIELKQWESAQFSDKDGIVSTFVGGGMREVSHPSYQAWSYAALLRDFNEVAGSESVGLYPCAYLHNYSEDNVIRHAHYAPYLERAPVFLRSDVLALRDFIKRYVRHGDVRDLLYRIEQGRIRPSRGLADRVAGLITGNDAFVMVDEQKLVYESVLQTALRASPTDKRVVIVRGGPGTGKSVVAVHLLAELTRRQLNARYVSKNAAPRAVYAQQLSGSLRKSVIDNLFTGSGSFVSTPDNTFDALIVDEAHRLNKLSGYMRNQGENQVKELISAACCTVFFLDEDQRVTLQDIGSEAEIRHWAERLGARVETLDLVSQFRCNGSDGYLAWLDHTLQIRDTANTTLDGVEYDLRVVDSPAELRDLIYERNAVNNKARLVAGYCWSWASRRNPKANDIEFPEYGFAAQWNLDTDGPLWIAKRDSVREVGCIHTCQGLEVDYVGVIIGPDMLYRDGRVVTNPAARAPLDKSIHGWRRLLEEDPEGAQQRLDGIIKNTYRTLMTRGMKGCYVYCVDRELGGRIKSLSK